MRYPICVTIRSLLLKVQDNNDVLSYWLSNASTLLLLLQRTLKASGAASLTPQRRRSTSTTLFGRMSQVRIRNCKHFCSVTYSSPFFFLLVSFYYSEAEFALDSTDTRCTLGQNAMFKPFFFWLIFRDLEDHHKVLGFHFLIAGYLEDWMIYGKQRQNIQLYFLNNNSQLSLRRYTA